MPTEKKQAQEHPYDVGREDLRLICKKATEQVILSDLNPPQFWEWPGVMEVIENCAERLGPRNIIFLIGPEGIAEDHPLKEKEREGKISVKCVSPDVPIRYFRLPIPHKGCFTLMAPNEKKPKYPWIRRLWNCDFAARELIKGISSMLKDCGMTSLAHNLRVEAVAATGCLLPLIAIVAIVTVILLIVGTTITNL